MDPLPAQIEAEFPAWRVQRGVDLFWYAERDGVMLRDENLTELRAQVASWERLHEPALYQRPPEAW